MSWLRPERQYRPDRERPQRRRRVSPARTGHVLEVPIPLRHRNRCAVRSHSISAALWLIRRETGGRLVADPVAVGQAKEAAFEVERQPQGELWVYWVLPDPKGASEGLHVLDEVADTSVFG